MKSSLLFLILAYKRINTKYDAVTPETTAAKVPHLCQPIPLLSLSTVSRIDQIENAILRTNKIEFPKTLVNVSPIRYLSFCPTALY